MASPLSPSFQNSFKYDVFISFRGEDTRKTFVDHLYEALKDKGIYTYKDDERIEQGKTIDNQLIQAIKDSRFFIIVFSQNYASSSWCLDELVEIMECQKTGEQIAYPVFFDVEPTHVRYQSGAFGKAFLENKNKDAAGKWIDALKGAAGLAGWQLKNTLDGHEAKLIKIIVQEISLELRSINFGFDEKLVGMETRVKDVVSSLEMGTDDVRMIGIKGMGGAGKTTLARAVFDHLSHRFEATSFVENVREVSKTSMFGLKILQEQVLSKVLNERVTLDSVNNGKNMMKRRMWSKKVLLVLDDVNDIEQLEALAGEPKWFKPGSRIIVTTRDKQVLVAHRVNSIRDIDLLSDTEAICLLSRYAFGREIPPQEYEELSLRVVLYADGLPLTVIVLGSFLFGKDKNEWVDAIDRLKRIPLKETLEKLELSYSSLEDEYKEIFLDIACILKGKHREYAIRVLECCGFYAKIGLKVLEQRSLITISKDEVLGMHDHIEEMGKNIVRRSHPNEPNKHSRLWIKEEIEDILANDMGTEETRCLKLDMPRGSSIILMKGLAKMKKLRYLEVNFDQDFDFERDDARLGKMKTLRLKVFGKIEQTRAEATQYFPNSLKYLKCTNYPFLYLPKTFEANNLVGLEIRNSRMVQLWKERKKKVLIKLKFLSLSWSKLTTFDFGMTPNLESLSLKFSDNLKELCMPVSCQKLNYLHISYSKLKTFDLGLTPNLETLSLDNCADFVKLQVSVACPNLKFLDLRKSRLRSLDLELMPNLERLNLAGCDELVEFNVPVGCMKKVVHLDLSGCALLEKLPEDLGRLECLEELDITYTGISHLPQSIFGLKGLCITASRELLQLYDFPSEIKTTTSPLWHDAKFINKIVQETSLELRPINFGFDEKLVGLETRIRDVVSSLEMGIDEVHMIGIKGMGGAGKTTLARAVFDHLSNDFEAKSFVKNVREVSNGSVSRLKKLQEQVLSDVLNEQVTLNSVSDGKNMMKKRMCAKKVLLVLDDVDHIEQLEALASEPKWFKPGSRIIITTRDEQVLVAHRVNVIRDIALLSKQEAICLFSRYAFGTENPVQGYKELSGKVVSYAAGLPLTIKVLGSFLCGKDKDEWVDAIERLKKIPLKETMEKRSRFWIEDILANDKDNSMASSSNISVQESFKYDVFLSFRGEDTSKYFVNHLYEALKDKGIYTYKNDEIIQKGERISDDIIKSIEDSKFYIIVFSKNYASSSWCLDELVKIMECHKMTGHTAYLVFYDVEPTEVCKQSGAVGEAFAKHEKEVRNQSGAVRIAFLMNKKKAMLKKWKGALKEAADLAGWELKNTLEGHEAKFINKIVQEISLQLRPINLGFDENLVGMKTRVKDVVSSLEVGIDEVRMIGMGIGGAGKTTLARAVFDHLSADFEAKSFVGNVREVSNGMETRVKDVVSSLEIHIDDVRMIGIKGMGGAGKTTLARAVFDHLYNDFEAKSFVENVREVSNASMFGLKNLQEQVLSDVLNEHVTLNGVIDGIKVMKERMRVKKVLLVLDDVDHIDQLEALASEPSWFKPGSRILITTRDEQVLVAHRVNLIRDMDLLSDEEAICIFSRFAFGRENPLQGYEELSRKVVRYAAGLPLTIKVLGSFLCRKDKLEWVDAIDKLKRIPLKETLEKLEFSYISLEDDYKEIFLDIACILKGASREYAIRVLECCGFHAKMGLKVLEQRSLITLSEDGFLGMHDHIEEMGKNIVRRSHPDEPNKHSRLWVDEEIEDILANDMGTQATRCLKLDKSSGNARIVMKGLGKMKKLRYLEVNFAYYDSETDCESDVECLDDTSQYFPNSLKYLKCRNYPFLYLPGTFQANNLVGLEMKQSRMVQLWEEGEKKVLRKLNFLSLYKSQLMTFDFRMTPSLKTLILRSSDNLVKLCCPVSCLKLKHLDISDSKLRTFDLGLTPNLETLSLDNCADFEELHLSVACPNLKFLDLRKSRLRSLDLELIPNLESLDLAGCDKLVEINAPVGCLKKVGFVNLSGCLRFSDFNFYGREPKVNCSSATLELVGESLDLCQLHPNSNLLKLRFRCSYKECLSSSVGNIEKLISFGLCACTDLKKISDIICSLRCLKKLTLKGDIPEFPKDLGRLKCLEELYLSSTKIKHLPDSICMLKCLKSLTVDDGDLLEKLPEGLGQLECLEKLYVSSKKIEYLPDSICMLKRLKCLDVRECCRLGKLPEAIGQLETLETLHLSATKITHLPDSICMLKHLNYLNLEDCALLEKLPEDIGRSECLEELNLMATKIKHLPDSICLLKHLKYLKLDHCALLEKLPEDLGLSECLKELVITDTGISHLPQSIFGLKGLLIVASSELLELYDFPSEIKTTTGTKH